jgi:phage-related protein
MKVKNSIATGLDIIKGIWGRIWGTFGPLLVAVWNFIKAVVRFGWTVIKEVTLTALLGLRRIVGAAWNWIKNVTGAAWNAIKAVILRAWGAIGPYVMGAVGKVRSTISNAWNFIRDVTSSVWSAVVNVIRDKVAALGAVVSTIRDKVMGALSGAASWLFNAGRDIIQGLIDGITSMLNSLTSAINSATDKVANFLPGSPVEEGPLKVLNRGYAGKQIVDMLAAGIEGAAPAIRSAMDNVIPAVPLGAPALPAGMGVGRSAASASVRFAGMRIVGDLEMRNGRAYISGIAAEEIDDEGGFNGTIGRMN